MTKLERLSFDAEQCAAVILSWYTALGESERNTIEVKTIATVFDDLNDRIFDIAERLREMTGEERDE